MFRNNHVIVIRFHFPENHPNFMWRFQYFAAVVLPAIRRQSCKDFDVAIWCNTWHANLFKSLDQNIITFGIKGHHHDYAKHKYADEIASGMHMDFVPWRAVRGLGKYEIQTAIDSDDLMIDRFYLEKTREVLAGSGTAHVCFAPLVFDLATLRAYTCRRQYNTEYGSAFYSIYQPKDRWENYIFAYEDSHTTIGQMMDRRICVSDNRYVAITCHDKNDSTTLGTADKEILPVALQKNASGNKITPDYYAQKAGSSGVRWNWTYLISVLKHRKSLNVGDALCRTSRRLRFFAACAPRKKHTAPLATFKDKRPKILIFLGTDDKCSSYYTTVMEVTKRLNRNFHFTVAKTIELDTKRILHWEGDLIWARCSAISAAKLLSIKPDYKKKIITSINIGSRIPNHIIESFKIIRDENHIGVFIQNKSAYDLLRTYDVKSTAYFVPNGVDVDVFKPSAPVSEFIVGFAGKYGDPMADAQKGFSEFFKPACEELVLKQKLADCRWHLKQGAADHRLDCTLHKNMYKFYQNISVLVQISAFEGCSNAVMEAMASGVPCIISRVGYHGEACEHNKNIILVDRDLNQVKAALMKLRDDKKFYNSIAQEARVFAEQHSWDRQAEKMKQVFYELLAKL